jgi:nitroimidazol reductase NimA-like FMN-containing flavoprotein (pyridoxamine 5'-phosphate oxidase superfamily)
MEPPNLTGPWSMSEIETFLGSAAIPARISAISTSGWPVIVSLWFLYENGNLFCATRSTSKIARLLTDQPRVAFEVSGDTPPYFGIRGQGLASISADGNGVLLSRLVERYLGEERPRFREWLSKGSKNEVAIRVSPVRIMSWDYRKRMAS